MVFMRKRAKTGGKKDIEKEFNLPGTKIQD
jgi:hypothetical protein